MELFKGDTVFQPKSWAVRGTVVGNLNALTVASNTKTGQTYGVEEAFAEKRLAVLSPAFDFVSIRGGMQNFNSDFRGYLFVDNQLGVRLFGNARATAISTTSRTSRCATAIRSASCTTSPAATRT